MLLLRLIFLVNVKLSKQSFLIMSSRNFKLSFCSHVLTMISSSTSVRKLGLVNNPSAHLCRIHSFFLKISTNGVFKTSFGRVLPVCQTRGKKLDLPIISKWYFINLCKWSHIYFLIGILYFVYLTLISKLVSLLKGW